MQGFYHLFPPIIANASFQSSGNLYSISPSRSSISNLPVHINAQIIYTRALRIIFPEKPVNPALIRLTICNQTGCECIVGASNPSLMKGWVFMAHEFHEFSCKRAQPKMSRKGAFYIDQWVECAVFTVLAAQVGRAASPIVAHSPGQRPGERCCID